MSYIYSNNCSPICQFYFNIKILFKRIMSEKSFKPIVPVVYPVGVTKIVKIFSDFLKSLQITAIQMIAVHSINFIPI